MQKNMFALLATFVTAGLVSACATTPNHSLAIQKENQTFEVTGLGKTELIAKNNAISAANKTCGSRSTPIVIDEKTQYAGALKGVVNESTGQMIQAAASVIGNMTGMKTGINQDDDYQTTLNFRCQAQ